MGIVLTRIEIGGSGPWRSWGPWLGLILIAVVLPTLILPLLLVAVLLELSASTTAVCIAPGRNPGRGGFARFSPRSPPLV